jgi:hypothetical protein
MNKKIVLILLTGLLLSACGLSGRTTGYVYAVDETFSTYTHNIWIKSDLESSESDCYRIRNELVEQALNAMKEKKSLTMQYNREIWNWAGCTSELIVEIL